MSYYIYCITNKINGKTYVGQRLCPKNKSPIKDSYMGSGELIVKAIKKYGLENFSKFILEENIINKKDVDKKEIYWISKFKKEGKCEYNISTGGTGGDLGEEVNAIIGAKNKKHWEDPKYRQMQHDSHVGISPANKGKRMTPEQIEKDRLAHLGKKQSAETIRKRVEKTKGKKRSEEFKQRLSKYFMGHEVSNETRKKMSEKAKGRTPWNKGKKMSEEYKLRVKETMMRNKYEITK